MAYICQGFHTALTKRGNGCEEKVVKKNINLLQKNPKPNPLNPYWAIFDILTPSKKFQATLKRISKGNGGKEGTKGGKKFAKNSKSKTQILGKIQATNKRTTKGSGEK